MHLFLVLISTWEEDAKKEFFSFSSFFLFSLPSSSTLSKTFPGFFLCPSHCTIKFCGVLVVTSLLKLQNPSQREKEYSQDSKGNQSSLGKNVKLENVNSQPGMCQGKFGFNIIPYIEELKLEQAQCPCICELEHFNYQ